MLNENHPPKEVNTSSKANESHKRLTKSTLKNAENSFTVTAKVKPKKKPYFKRTMAIVLLIILGVAGGYGAVKALDTYQKKTEQAQQEQIKQEKAEKKAQAIKEADNPLSVLIGEVEAPSGSALKSSVKKDKLKFDSSELSIKGAKMKATINGCKLESTTDICLAARGSIGESDFDVFVTKDLSRTRIFENPDQFAEVETPGSTTAARIAIDMNKDKTSEQFGALTLSGTTGFIIAFPENTPESKVEDILKSATVI